MGKDLWGEGFWIQINSLALNMSNLRDFWEILSRSEWNSEGRSNMKKEICKSSSYICLFVGAGSEHRKNTRLRFYKDSLTKDKELWIPGRKRKEEKSLVRLGLRTNRDHKRDVLDPRKEIYGDCRSH